MNSQSSKQSRFLCGSTPCEGSLSSIIPCDLRTPVERERR
jgi:hypothetical protein